MVERVAWEDVLFNFMNKHRILLSKRNSDRTGEFIIKRENRYWCVHAHGCSDDFQLDKTQTHLGRGVWAFCMDFLDLV